MRKTKLSKEEKKAMSDIINQVLNMDIDWTRLKDDDLIALFKRFSNRVTATGGIVGAIANDWANILLKVLEERANARLSEIIQQLQRRGVL